MDQHSFRTIEINPTIQKRIDKLFNDKIPFMQSKDILRLGYMYGLEDAKKEKECKSTEKKNFKKQTPVDFDKKVKDENIKILGDILMYMNNPDNDFISVYAYIKSKADALKTNNTNNFM